MFEPSKSSLIVSSGISEWWHRGRFWAILECIEQQRGDICEPHEK